METELVGRQEEQAELALARDSGRAELIAIYGRRRIGKTFLVRHFYAPQLCFELTGQRDATLTQQLAAFAASLNARTRYRHSPPPDWPAAFAELVRYLDEQLRAGARKAVFIDELPWLAGRRSGFLPAFEHFWNSWASRQKNLIVVICGSAASWMIAKILHQKGGLHNRVTRSIALQPFRLSETDAFLRSRGVRLERQQILELTMATGGIPYYLDYVRKGRSAAQNIDAMFFVPNAPLHDEFDKLFAALFEHHERHIKVIRALARKASGLQRQELVAAAKLPSGGNLTTILDELEASGFVQRIVPFGRTARDTLYRLADEFTLFHLRWRSGKRELTAGAGQWQRFRSSPAWQAWAGYAFENLCIKHVLQIKQALGIAGVETEAASWRYRPAAADERGAQIDLLIDRRDGIINVCEMKYSDTEFIVDKQYAQELRNKLNVFRRVTATRKSLFLTMVTTHGVAANSHSSELVQNIIHAEALFAV